MTPARASTASILHYGFMEEVDIPRDLAGIKTCGEPFNMMSTSFFLGRQKLIASKTRAGHGAVAREAVRLDAQELRKRDGVLQAADQPRGRARQPAADLNLLEVRGGAAGLTAAPAAAGRGGSKSAAAIPKVRKAAPPASAADRRWCRGDGCECGSNFDARGPSIESGERARTNFAGVDCPSLGVRSALASSVADENSWDRRIVIAMPPDAQRPYRRCASAWGQAKRSSPPRQKSLRTLQTSERSKLQSPGHRRAGRRSRGD